MIDVTNSGGLWRLTLNRPDKANALNVEMIAQLRDAALAAKQDKGLRAFVLTGAGERVFCAGADMDSTDDMFAFTRAPEWSEMSNAIATLPCLSIAALNGTVAGGGFAPVLACDVRICTPSTKFFYPVLKRGFLPQPADVERLSSLVGTARAKLILMAGQKLNAETARNIGLVEEISELSGFETIISMFTADALAAKPEQVAAINKLFDPSLDEDGLEDCYRASYEKDSNALDRITGRSSGNS